MSKFKVLYTDTDSGEYSIEASVLSKIDAEIFLASATDEETLIREGSDCDGVLVLYADITKNVLDAWGKAGHVKVVARQGIGYNNIDVEAATANGIMVANVPDYCLDEVADHTMALALSLVRELKAFNQKVNQGEWNEIPVRKIHRINQMKFGLLGFGGIGRRVAARAKAFGFQVAAYDPFVPDGQWRELGIEKAISVDALLREADVLSLHMPQTNETTHMIDAEAFRKMKPTAFLINTSRGALINEQDLEYAIENGLIAGAGLDVLEEEPPRKDSALSTLSLRDNVILTSHIAFYSEESRVEILTKIAENVASTLTTGRPVYLVNKDVCDTKK